MSFVFADSDKGETNARVLAVKANSRGSTYAGSPGGSISDGSILSSPEPAVKSDHSSSVDSVTVAPCSGHKGCGLSPRTSDMTDDVDHTNDLDVSTMPSASVPLPTESKESNSLLHPRADLA